MVEFAPLPMLPPYIRTTSGAGAAAVGVTRFSIFVMPSNFLGSATVHPAQRHRKKKMETIKVGS